MRSGDNLKIIIDDVFGGEASVFRAEEQDAGSGR